MPLSHKPPLEGGLMMGPSITPLKLKPTQLNASLAASSQAHPSTLSAGMTIGNAVVFQGNCTCSFVMQSADFTEPTILIVIMQNFMDSTQIAVSASSIECYQNIRCKCLVHLIQRIVR